MTERPRVIFYGSPHFAVPTLQALIDSPYRPIAVVTQPDAAAGRGRALHPPPVKELAAEHAISTLQPARLRSRAAVAQIASLRPDLQIVAAYGQIIPTDLLDLAQRGTLNVHASLLPRWRGAAPISAAILHGDPVTGITIMLVDETEDTGQIVRQRATPIEPTEHAGALGDRLAAMGSQLLLETIPDWLAGTITPQPQDPALATRARRVRKTHGRIDWTQPAEHIARHVRAFTPWPAATTELGRTAIRILQTAAADRSADAPPGVIIGVGETIDVATGDGVLAVSRLQRAGKRALSAEEFARGARKLLGQRFGASDRHVTGT